MAHLLTWTRIHLLTRRLTIYSRYQGGKHHFRWLLRWRNLPVRASPPLRPASAYSLLTACFMPLYTWLDVYRHRIPTGRARARLSSLSLSLYLSLAVPFPCYPPPFRSVLPSDVVRHCFLVFKIFCQFLWKLRPDRSNCFSPSLPLPLAFSRFLSHSLSVSLSPSSPSSLSPRLSLSLFTSACPRSPFFSRSSLIRWAVRCCNIRRCVLGLSPDLGYDSITSRGDEKSASSESTGF